MTTPDQLTFGAFSSVLVANRGEIAARVIRTAHDEGLRAIAVHSEPDAGAPHVRLADEAHTLTGAAPAETYLSIDKVIDIARASGAEAVHPGYGFLSESAAFAQAVIAAGLIWIGPPPSAIESLGNKLTARAIARSVGAPLAPGTDDLVATIAELETFVDAHGLPVVIKAAYGGGGRGLRLVRDRSRLAEELAAAQREAVAAFGHQECFVERYLDRARHVEAQVLVDRFGNTVVAGTRDCSVQRRHQKLIEEAPAPFLSDDQSTRIAAAAKQICKAAGYVGAGTVEFLVAADGTVSFLEVNTRLQVEHPVTEETTGIDLVAEQFAIARGEALRLAADPRPRGHSIELRINCEDPRADFRPTPGVVTAFELPQGPGIRVDVGAESGSAVLEWYDSLIGKLIVWGRDRPSALARARRAIAETHVDGVPTVLPLDEAILSHPDFVAAHQPFGVHTGWLEEHLPELLGRMPAATPGADAIEVTIGRQSHRVAMPGLGLLDPEWAEQIRSRIGTAADDPAQQGDVVRVPMQGTIVKIDVAEGDAVEVGDLIAVVEAMKMENSVRAHRVGRVVGLEVMVGDTRGQGDIICRLEQLGPAETG